MSLKTRWYAGMLHYYDSIIHETLLALAPVWFVEEFLGATLDTNRWTRRDTGGATQPEIGDGENGGLALLLSATNEVQLAGLDWGDHRPLRLNQCLAIEYRFRFTTLPTGAVVAVVGLAGDHHAAVNSVAESLWVRADGSGVLTVESDDTVHETSQIATGVTLVASELCILRIECEVPAACRFFINGARVAGGTTFDMSQVAGLALQPVMRIGKEGAAASVGRLDIDYVKIWQKRF